MGFLFKSTKEKQEINTRLQKRLYNQVLDVPGFYYASNIMREKNSLEDLIQKGHEKQNVYAVYGQIYLNDFIERLACDREIFKAQPATSYHIDTKQFNGEIKESFDRLNQIGDDFTASADAVMVSALCLTVSSNIHERICDLAAQVYCYNAQYKDDLSLGKLGSAFLDCYDSLESYVQGNTDEKFYESTLKNLKNSFASYDEFKEYIVSELTAYEKDCLDYAMWADKHNFLGVKGKIVNPIKKLRKTFPPETRRDYSVSYTHLTLPTIYSV